MIVSKSIAPGAKTVLLDLTGTGTVSYDLYLNGQFLETKTLEFTK